jgi:hypothetical protein
MLAGPAGMAVAHWNRDVFVVVGVSLRDEM